jgi:benzodiazapine receptor
VRITRPVLTAAASALFVGALGGAATQIGPWYYGLVKPSWQPPDWLFAPVWTLIYGLTALAGVLVWNRIADRERRLRLMALFALNALLNVLWSELFFGQRRPDWALSEVVPFWLSILVLVLLVFPVTRTGGWALVPYLIWVLFAGILNLAIVRLNGPFSA